MSFMQQIFHNAKFNSMTESVSDFEAMLVNDGVIVFAGTNEEILNMKTDDHEVVDLKGKKVYPSFFDVDSSIYDLIETDLKNAKKFKYIENPDDFDENFEKFDNYDIYKKEFLKIQKEFLLKGITTVQELYMGSKEFTFWKKLADEKALILNVIGYVDIINSKVVMDNNCRSYRKYKNGFRLGGYSFAIDGELSRKEAWVQKSYKREKGYVGYSELFDEQLSYLIKTALEEKKQLVVETNGDRAVDQFLRCFEEVKTKEKVEDVFRPIALKCNLLSKKQLLKMKELGIVPSFQTSDLIEKHDALVKAIGRIQCKKIQPLALAEKFGLKFLIQSNRKQVANGFEIIENLNSGKLSKCQTLTESTLFNVIYSNTAYAMFDQDQKGSLENGKQATFVVLDESGKIDEVYVCGEKIKK